MSVVAVIGGQWGDEGKGKVVDNLAAHAKYDLRKMRRGMITPEDWSNLHLAAGDLEILLVDLRSRVRALPIAQIAPPDEALLRAVLVKLFSDRQLTVEPEVIGYLVVRMERSMAAARRGRDSFWSRKALFPSSAAVTSATGDSSAGPPTTTTPTWLTIDRDSPIPRVARRMARPSRLRLRVRKMSHGSKRTGSTFSPPPFMAGCCSRPACSDGSGA